MKSLRFGGLAICLVLIGAATGACDETPSVRWRATYVPGKAAEAAKLAKELPPRFHPKFVRPVSIGRYVVPVKKSSHEAVNSHGILASCRRMIARILEVFFGFLAWVNSYPKGSSVLAMILIYLMRWINGEPMP